jgi:DNA-binding MurR/RpiR family transcriptional regulator
MAQSQARPRFLTVLEVADQLRVSTMTVYRLITKDSIEDSIVKLHVTKQQMAGALLHDGDAIAGLSAEELVQLVSASVSQPA